MMEKSIKLALNNYLITPASLKDTQTGGVVDEVLVDMAQLFHHHYLDTRGYGPPDPDPAKFEHLSFFSTDRMLCLLGDGIGISTAFRISRSNELGQAFCRWFLYEHLNITYFAHMHDVINKPSLPAFADHTIERTKKGDTPDYLCSKNVRQIFLAEAKSRREAISFKNASFSRWRKQFERVVVKDTTGSPRTVKGHIVAVRLAAESDGPRIRSKLFAEDPASPGDRSPDEESPLGAVAMLLHYSDIANKIAQPILAAALAGSFTVPDEILFPAVVWEFRIGPLAGKRFIGGFYMGDAGTPEFVKEQDGLAAAIHPFRLDQSRSTFFGLEENIFRSLTRVARVGSEALVEVTQLSEIPFIYSGVSILRDGSVIGPIEFFRVVGDARY